MATDQQAIANKANAAKSTGKYATAMSITFPEGGRPRSFSAHVGPRTNRAMSRSRPSQLGAGFVGSSLGACHTYPNRGSRCC